MNKLFGIIFCVLPFLLHSQSQFKVELNLVGLKNNKVRVSHIVNGKSKVDTLTPKKDDYILWEGKTVDPQLVRMEVLDTSLYLRIGKAIALPPALTFMLTNNNFVINGNAKEIWTSTIVTNDEESLIYEKFRAEDLPITLEVWEIQKKQNIKANAKDTVGTAALKDESTALRRKNQQLRVQYIDKYPAAFSSILMLQGLFLVLPVDILDKKFKALDEKYKSSQTAKDLGVKIQNNKNTAIGQPAVTFVQTSFDGATVDLAAMKGKVVLLDFWGSWCVPCRQSHPKLKEAYEKYKSLGFEIVGVSNEAVSKGKSKEQQDAAWRKAIAEDGIQWPNVLYDADLNDIVKSYDIMGYPTKYLIDQKGNIVSKILGNSPNNHDILIKKLDELLIKKE